MALFKINHEQVVQNLVYFFRIRIEDFASIFGYPENPGMPYYPPRKDWFWQKTRLADHLPVHVIPPKMIQHPKTIPEMIFGDFPATNFIPRISMDNLKDYGPYGFVIPNYRNIHFLPNQLSEYLQLKHNILTNVDQLDEIKESIFYVMLAYFHLVTFRYYLSMIPVINPYVGILKMIPALVDWTEDISLGLFPTILGFNTGPMIILSLIGRAADNVCHYVFTMPYLPSEGQPGFARIDGKITPVLHFQHLPVLWYHKTIPNELRKYWYYHKPEILKYMQLSYGKLNLTLLPDEIIEELKKHENLTTLNSLVNTISHQILAFHSSFINHQYLDSSYYTSKIIKISSYFLNLLT
uniref:Uncharacterized protein n=1 Tax=Astrosyne radiata TaxID=1158023 RepID=A0A2U9NT80_9STRA|nr:hypothetical protein ycf89 [Astrosyne radiata]YP_009497678.1 hypothetical protein ycf89 [Astrosyne radiata]AWT40334.1 hypothetical protein ycf89 [Astrosyne radiata]AWT40391.1 hypothetical protein ycf89 [Astrosyne radiata]